MYAAASLIYPGPGLSVHCLNPLFPQAPPAHEPTPGNQSSYKLVNDIDLSGSVRQIFSMSAISQSALTISWEEYESGEFDSEIRHEFVNGVVYAMAGGSDNHARIALNIASELRQRLKGGPCEAFGSDMKVRIESGTDTFGYYPDVMVACDPDDNNRYHRERPIVLFEVISSSTERTDKHEKMLAYRMIPSLEEYIVLEQSVPRALIYKRSSDWVPEFLDGMDSELVLQSIDCRLPFSDLYDRVTWPDGQ
jgi:Uma2 family endonuclease